MLFSFIFTVIGQDYLFALRPPKAVIKTRDEHYHNILEHQQAIKGMVLKISEYPESISLEKIYSEQQWLFGDYLEIMGEEIKDTPVLVLEVRLNLEIVYLILEGNHRVFKGKKDGKKHIKACVIRPKFHHDVIVEEKISKTKKGIRKLFTMDEMIVGRPVTAAIFPSDSRLEQLDQKTINSYFIKWTKEINEPGINYKIGDNKMYYSNENRLPAFRDYLVKALSGNKSNISWFFRNYKDHIFSCLWEK